MKKGRPFYPHLPFFRRHGSREKEGTGAGYFLHVANINLTALGEKSPSLLFLFTRAPRDFCFRSRSASEIGLG